MARNLFNSITLTDKIPKPIFHPPKNKTQNLSATITSCNLSSHNQDGQNPSFHQSTNLTELDMKGEQLQSQATEKVITITMIINPEDHHRPIIAPSNYTKGRLKPRPCTRKQRSKHTEHIPCTDPWRLRGRDLLLRIRPGEEDKHDTNTSSLDEV